MTRTSSSNGPRWDTSYVFNMHTCLSGKWVPFESDGLVIVADEISFIQGPFEKFEDWRQCRYSPRTFQTALVIAPSV